MPSAGSLAYWSLGWGQLPHDFPFPLQVLFFPNQPVANFYLLQPFSTVWAVLKSGTMESEFRSSRVTRATKLSMLGREELFWDTNAAQRVLKEDFSRLLVSGLDTASAKHSIKMLQLLPLTRPSHFLLLSLCPILEPAFLGCPGQSRDHTLLPKRPRMPATGFIDGDWTA